MERVEYLEQGLVCPSKLAFYVRGALAAALGMNREATSMHVTLQLLELRTEVTGV